MSELVISKADTANVIELAGELDLGSVAKLDSALAELPPGDEAILDLRGLLFVDSCGIHCILRHAESRNAEAPIVLLDASPSIGRLFDMVSIDRNPGVELRRTMRKSAA